MARRSQCSSAGDNPLDPNYLPPHYREEYRLAIDALVEEDLEGYYNFLQKADVVDFLSTREIEYIQSSVQVPHKSHHPEHPEQPFLDTGGDGSSDTYWPIHSDLDVPGLDLGWPQIHHFIGPTEVTTLVNPPESGMPSIKDQARRLVKNAQQVIAIVMDMFTDVDMFADILNAAMRKVAVYIILDEKNAHHFVNMVSCCRVNLESIQFLRVRTVSGTTYHCRSGKSFKGQMMDRFLLTDCRAVLSGNYSFMWSFEKLHRCMAHLFLGQLVSTFDEEFRILFAQSQPLMVENLLLPAEEINLLQMRQYPTDRGSFYRDSRKYLSLDTGQPEQWRRHSYDEQMDVDWRMMPLKKQESLQGPSDMYRFPPQLPGMEPPYDQGSSRIPMLENPAFKRHSYAEGGQGRFSSPFPQQQGMPEPENQGRQFHRGHQPYPGPGPGPEVDYSGYDKFMSQNYLSADQYSESPHNFDPVLNYLSSTRNVDPSSENLAPAADLPFSSSHPRRLNVGQSYACQKSPTPVNPPDQKQFFQEPSTDRKDPRVKQGLRNLRISSYLCAHDNPEDDDLPSAPPQVPDPFEEPSYPMQPTALGIDFLASKIPNVREFKVPALPRASQMPIYSKNTAREEPKKAPDESNAVEKETKLTARPSESSSTAEGGKAEEAEQKEPKTSILRRNDSFRRKQNPATPRCSRLRSSLIFSSLEQLQGPQDDEEGDKNDTQQTKLPFVSQVLQRKSAPREPIEWSRYIKQATTDESATETSKPDNANTQAGDIDQLEEGNSNVPSKPSGIQVSDEEQANSSPLMPGLKPSKVELPINVQQPKSLLTTPLVVDMSDPDNRLMFFKELAAKRKAALAAEAEKKKVKAPVKPPADLKGSNNVKREEPDPKETTEKMNKAESGESAKSKDTALIPADRTQAAVKSREPKRKEKMSAFERLLEINATAEDEGKYISAKECESLDPSSEDSHKTSSLIKNDPSASSQAYEERETKSLTESEQMNQKIYLETSLSGSGKNESPQSSPGHPPTPTDVTAASGSFHGQGTGDSESSKLGSTSQEFSLLAPISVGVSPSSADAALDSKLPKACSPLPHEKDPHHMLSNSGSKISPISTPVETMSSNVGAEDSTSTSIKLSLNTDNTENWKSVQLSLQETSKLVDKMSEKESLKASLDPGSYLELSKSPSAVPSSPVKSERSHDTFVTGLEPNTSSSHSTSQTNFEKTCDATQDVLACSENKSVEDVVTKKPEVLGSSTDVNAAVLSSSLSTLLSDSGLAKISGVENSISDQREAVTSTPKTEILAAKDVPTELSFSGITDMIPSASQSETTPTATHPSKPTGFDIPDHAETVLCPSILNSVGSVLSPQVEKPEINLATIHSPSDTNCVLQQITTGSDETQVFPEMSSPKEVSSKISTEPDVPCRRPESEIAEGHTLETTVPSKNNQEPKKESEDTESANKVKKESISYEITSDKCSEAAEITSEEVVALSPQSKQPNSSQSRYHSSTVNVLSSSNLRDDTKLLLEQISANSQSRNESNKEAPVTDDEKEDEADKFAKREKERRIGTSNKGQPKSTQEREKLLERIHSMRKERKVYSRFEV